MVAKAGEHQQLGAEILLLLLDGFRVERGV